jgi:hypothetical protein
MPHVRRVQACLGRSGVSTTMICTHALSSSAAGVRDPLESLPISSAREIAPTSHAIAGGIQLVGRPQLRRTQELTIHFESGPGFEMTRLKALGFGLAFRL